MRRRIGKGWAATIGFALALGSAAVAIAAPGSLDSTFSVDGKQTIDFGATSEAARSHAIAPGGTIYGAGGRLSGSSNLDDFQVFSLTPAGEPNTAFSTDGKQTVGFASNTTDNSRAILILPSGRIIVGGSTTMSPSGSGASDPNFGLARLLPTGNLDVGFSEDGVVAAEIAGQDTLTDLALDSEGRIVAVGNSGAGIGIARFTASGTPDTSFDADGVKMIDLGGSEDVRGVAIDSSDRILVSGRTKPTGGVFGTSNLFVVRLHKDGTPDSGFAGGGTFIGGVAAGHEEDGGDVAIDPNGRIVLAGWVGTPDLGPYAPASEINLAAIRLKQDGSFDDSFSGDGRAMFDVGTSDFGANVAVTPASKLVIGGESGTTFIVAQITAGGELDSGFGTGGVTAVSFGGPAASALGAVRLDRTGAITASGQMKPTGTTDNMAIAKIEGDPLDLDTAIDSGPPTDKTLTSNAVEFSFSSPSPGVVGFECAWPNETFEPCTSPAGREHVTDGQKTFRVRAVNNLGAVDPTPAERTFTIDNSAPFLQIKRRKLRLDDEGRMTAKIRCSFERSGPCEGALVLRTIGKFALDPAAAAKRKAKTVKLAKARYSIKPKPKTRKLKLRIRSDRKLKLIRQKPLARQVVAIARVRDQVGNSDVVEREMKIVP